MAVLSSSKCCLELTGPRQLRLSIFLACLYVTKKKKKSRHKFVTTGREEEKVSEELYEDQSGEWSSLQKDIVDLAKPRLSTYYKLSIAARMERVYDCLVPMPQL
jgi:hypothetical protein